MSRFPPPFLRLLESLALFCSEGVREGVGKSGRGTALHEREIRAYTGRRRVAALGCAALLTRRETGGDPLSQGPTVWFKLYNKKKIEEMSDTACLLHSLRQRARVRSRDGELGHVHEAIKRQCHEGTQNLAAANLAARRRGGGPAIVKVVKRG